MTVRILIGDVRDKLAELPDESVHCVVTSPPYFGLRDYGTAQWDGGDPACDHKGMPMASPRSTLGLGKGQTSHDAAMRHANSFGVPYRSVCGKCGATRIDNQIGLEPTLAEYIDTMTAVFRDVRRVLRSDGVCWLNIGDSYAGAGAGGGGNRKGNEHGQHDAMVGSTRGVVPAGLKPKDLMMVPARLALALQADGWWLRSDCIWHKPNTMPESVTDRPTNAHEHIFLLTKSARYWYDADAVREEQVIASPEEARSRASKSGAQYDKWEDAGGFRGMGGLSRENRTFNPAGRNLRNVWSISTQGFPGAHFAVFPEEIPRRCIKAGTSEKGACSACGAPWSRVVDKVNPRLSDEYDARPQTPKMSAPLAGRNDYGGKTGLAKPGWREFPPAKSETTGWQPGCTCDADVIPCTVMDIFFGSGTTGLVADQLGRDCIGIELNPTYAKLAEDRIRDAAPMFAQVTA